MSGLLRCWSLITQETHRVAIFRVRLRDLIRFDGPKASILNNINDLKATVFFYSYY